MAGVVIGDVRLKIPCYLQLSGDAVLKFERRVDGRKETLTRELAFHGSRDRLLQQLRDVVGHFQTVDPKNPWKFKGFTHFNVRSHSDTALRRVGRGRPVTS